MLRYTVIHTYRFIHTYTHTSSHGYLFILKKHHFGQSYQINSKPKQPQNARHLFYRFSGSSEHNWDQSVKVKKDALVQYKTLSNKQDAYEADFPITTNSKGEVLQTIYQEYRRRYFEKIGLDRLVGCLTLLRFYNPSGFFQ